MLNAATGNVVTRDRKIIILYIKKTFPRGSFSFLSLDTYFFLEAFLSLLLARFS